MTLYTCLIESLKIYFVSLNLQRSIYKNLVLIYRASKLIFFCLFSVALKYIRGLYGLKFQGAVFTKAILAQPSLVKKLNILAVLACLYFHSSLCGPCKSE